MKDYSSNWDEENEFVLNIFRQTALKENIKWGIPIFSFNKTHVVAARGFKNHFAVWFYDGVLLDDPQKLLVNASEGKTKALRQLRFYNKEEFDEKLIRFYLDQAVRNAKAGKTFVEEKTDNPLFIPPILQSELDNDKALNAAFRNLTPCKQKEYCEYIDDAKQEKTKLSRIEKIKPLILENKGLNDKYC